MARSRTILSGIALCALALSGCYSATQTPVIGARELRREGAASPTDEQRFLADVCPQPPAAWRPGKRWRVTDDRLRLLLRGLPPSSSLDGRDLTFVAMAGVPSVSGAEVTDLTFAVGADTVSYRIDLTPVQVMEREELVIPFTVDMDMTEAVRSRLAGRELYVMTPTWLDAAGNYIKGRRYVPVTVTDVLPGTPQAPVRIVISPGYDPSVSASLLMTMTPQGTGPRDFASLFSLTDPRRRHQDIYPDIWELITRGEVREGMTREECRLALGAPSEVKRREYYGMTREIWTYGNGSYLQFDDGVLRIYNL